MLGSGRERYVVLGFGPVKASWFVDLARWATGAAVPIELVKCVSVGEVRAQLEANRRFSAAVLDGGTNGVDRDLLHRLAAKGCVPLVVESPRVERDWVALGAAAALPTDLRRADLLGALERHAKPVEQVAAVAPADGVVEWPDDWPDRPHAPLVALLGAGGTGVSVLSMALAQTLATEHLGPHRRTNHPEPDPDDTSLAPVLLADFARRADQALLHDAGEIVPGVQELTDAHSIGRPASADIRGLTYAVPDRDYRLLLGLRRPRDWTALRPRAFEASLDSLLALHSFVVADIDHDLEGEAETGSIDVEDRNLLARTVVAKADVIFVIGLPGPTGMANLVRLTDDLHASGLATGTVIPVVNRAPRNPRTRAHIAKALAELRLPGHPVDAGSRPASPVFVTEHKRLDEALHDAVRLPASLGAPLAAALRAALAGVGTPPVPSRPAVAAPEPQRVVPGSLGSWAADEDE